MENHNRDLEMVVTAAFCEPFSAASAIEALNHIGFEDADIGMIGVLDAPDADLTWFWQSVGVPFEHASYYQSSLEDGGVLLIVRARETAMKDDAVALLNQRGGLFPPALPSS